ncbi:uncharacterized protein BXZ73DRAFT_107089 [Epithele typhae]|uniref:uncharacterized protein n=1 Tax=Epithele typhae TaxID=378194 RepID=UPI002007C9DB|nr:uncharacterized protein BXZ73DRAFT_107089 [Epithele typhae]KAH9913003.1 hypothetical protein BXZ73DRAFT_107089 [Epithele typhae]
MEKHAWQPVHLQCYENVPRLDGTGNKRPRIHLTPTRLLSQHAIPSRRRWSTWALPALVSLCIVVLWNASWQPTASREPQRKSNGLTDVVQWDNYTLFLHGQRMFLHSGEFHTFRLPVPELWLDVFQKMVAVGFNSVSVYIHMGLTNPSRGVMDFDDWRSLEAMYDAAKLTGLFVVLRPGPYINAETTAGGISAWITAETPSVVRTNATDWFDAYEPFIDAIIDGTKAHQVTEGGAVLAIQIDNEYEQNEVTGAYFERLEEQYRKNGIIVPLTYNDPNMRRAFVNGTGAVDIYGMDAYPQRFDCSHPSVWNPVVTNYHQYHSEVNPSQPWYMPEYQAGAFDPWGGPGYDACFELTGPEFEDVFYKQNWAANAKLLSYYMFYGGTNWGGLAEPDVYTSYDYGSPMRETRLLSKKYDEIKRQGLFVRSSPEFRKTDWVGDSSTGVPELSLSNDAAFVTYLRNPDSGTGFFIVRQDNSTTTQPLSFQITVPFHQPNGRLTLPLTLDAIALDGRQSKVIITDYHFGKHGHLVYTTAEVFFASRIGARDVLFLQGRATQAHEFAMTLVASRRPRSPPPFADPRVRHHAAAINGAPTVFTVLPGTTGLVTVWESAGQLVLYADADTAATFWAPHVPAPTANTVPGWEHFWQWGTNETVLVGGPYLVRNASVEHGTLKLRGDLEKEVMLTVIAPEDVTRVTWNGDAVDVLADLHGASAVRTGTLVMKGRARGFVLPELKGWKYHDSLPEIEKDFDDSEWITANKTVTYSYQQPLFGDGAVLYGCDYGFCENTVFLRGHFDANGSETGANLTIFGGDYFAASVWINDKFIASVQSSTDHANYMFTFPEGSVVAGEENVLTVLYDNQGLDESENEKSARGIAGYVLEGGNFTMWKVQGKAGGYTNYPDKLRGLLNEGGLYAERQGWHLPDFDTSSWDSRELSAGLPGGTAGVGFFVATFELDVPSETDVPMSFQFEPDGQPYRALLFVNGWQYGKRIANVGPQTRFPVPQGILNYNGKNTVAIALWATNNTAVSPGLALEIDGWLEGGVGSVTPNNPPWSPRNCRRDRPPQTQHTPLLFALQIFRTTLPRRLLHLLVVTATRRLRTRTVSHHVQFSAISLKTLRNGCSHLRQLKRLSFASFTSSLSLTTPSSTPQAVADCDKRLKDHLNVIKIMQPLPIAPRKPATTLATARRRLGLNIDDYFDRVAVCTVCYKVYSQDDLDALSGPQCTVSRCKGIAYKSSEKRSAARSNGEDPEPKRDPAKILLYAPLLKALPRLLLREEFIRNLDISCGEAPDNGGVLKDFQDGQAYRATKLDHARLRMPDGQIEDVKAFASVISKTPVGSWGA